MFGEDVVVVVRERRTSDDLRAPANVAIQERVQAHGAQNVSPDVPRAHIIPDRMPHDSTSEPSYSSYPPIPLFHHTLPKPITDHHNEFSHSPSGRPVPRVHLPGPRPLAHTARLRPAQRPVRRRRCRARERLGLPREPLRLHPHPPRPVLDQGPPRANRAGIQVSFTFPCPYF